MILKQIFINIPVNDLGKTMHFFQAIGFTLNPLYTDNNQNCLVWSDTIYLMLQSRDFTNSYLQKAVIDPSQYQVPSFTLPVDSKEMVDEILRNALHAGATEPVATITEDFMYLRSIQDIDGYMWGILFLDEDQFKKLIK